MNPKDYKKLVYDIIGAAMEVHQELKWGLLEPIYNEAMHLELLSRGIENQREVMLHCFYKNHILAKYYKVDLMVDDVIVELKSVDEIIPAHRAQLFNYMRLTRKPIAILLNFGERSLHGERYAYFEETNECVMLDKNMDILYNQDDY